MTLNGCATRDRQPDWEPHTYFFSNEVGSCKLIDGYSDTIFCESKRMEEMTCIPLENLEALQRKLQRCEKWR